MSSKWKFILQFCKIHFKSAVYNKMIAEKCSLKHSKVKVLSFKGVF